LCWEHKTNIVGKRRCPASLFIGNIVSINLCHYCSKPATHTFKNGKHCCEKVFKKCEYYRNQTKKQVERDWTDPSRKEKASAGLNQYYENRTEEERIRKSEKCRQATQTNWDNKTEEERQAYAKMRSEVQTEVAKQFTKEELTRMAEKKKESWANKTEDEISAITDKKIDTMRERFGVDWISQSPEISEKQQNRFNHKEFKFPSGRVDRVQGFEPAMLKILLEEGIDEYDIVTSRKDVPEIWYEDNGGKHRYFPDIYIKSQNKIIEVKSTWTWSNDEERTRKKIQKCQELGYDAEVYVIDNNKIFAQYK
jgi:hypothetical protein